MIKIKVGEQEIITATTTRIRRQIGDISGTFAFTIPTDGETRLQFNKSGENPTQDQDYLKIDTTIEFFVDEVPIMTGIIERIEFNIKSDKRMINYSGRGLWAQIAECNPFPPASSEIDKAELETNIRENVITNPSVDENGNQRDDEKNPFTASKFLSALLLPFKPEGKSVPSPPTAFQDQKINLENVQPNQTVLQILMQGTATWRHIIIEDAEGELTFFEPKESENAGSRLSASIKLPDDFLDFTASINSATTFRVYICAGTYTVGVIKGDNSFVGVAEDKKTERTERMLTIFNPGLGTAQAGEAQTYAEWLSRRKLGEKFQAHATYARHKINGKVPELGEIVTLPQEAFKENDFDANDFAIVSLDFQSHATGGDTMTIGMTESAALAPQFYPTEGGITPSST